jgi:hypothetical protein
MKFLITTTLLILLTTLTIGIWQKNYLDYELELIVEGLIESNTIHNVDSNRPLSKNRQKGYDLKRDTCVHNINNFLQSDEIGKIYEKFGKDIKGKNFKGKAMASIGGALKGTAIKLLNKYYPLTITEYDLVPVHNYVRIFFPKIESLIQFVLDQKTDNEEKLEQQKGDEGYELGNTNGVEQAQNRNVNDKSMETQTIKLTVEKNNPEIVLKATSSKTTSMSNKQKSLSTKPIEKSVKDLPQQNTNEIPTNNLKTAKKGNMSKFVNFFGGKTKEAPLTLPQEKIIVQITEIQKNITYLKNFFTIRKPKLNTLNVAKIIKNFGKVIYIPFIEKLSDLMLQPRFWEIFENLRNGFRKYATLVPREEDIIKAKKNTMTKEEDDIKAKKNTMMKEEDIIEAKKNTMTKEEDDIEAKEKAMKKEKEKDDIKAHEKEIEKNVNVQEALRDFGRLLRLILEDIRLGP